MLIRLTGIDIQIQGQFDFVCGKNYNSDNRVRIKILVKLQRVYERMTWLGEAMKDGVSTDMPRVAANWL